MLESGLWGLWLRCFGRNLLGAGFEKEEVEGGSKGVSDPLTFF